MNYYVAPTGSDNNPGTQASPWLTIQHAASAITNGPTGVTVHVAPGAYTGSVEVDLNGSATAPVIFVSDQQWGATLDAQNSMTEAWLLNGDYQQVIGFDVSNAATLGIIYKGNYDQIIGNRVHDMALDYTLACTDNGAAAIDDLNYAATNAVIALNVVYNIGPDGGLPCGNVSTVQGIYCSTVGLQVYGNLVSNVSDNCIQSYHAGSNLTIVNNTVMNCGHTGVMLAGGGSGSTAAGNVNSVVANNIVMNSPNATGLREYGTVSGNNFYNNLLYNTGAILLLNGSESGDITADPMVVNDTGTVATGNYALQSGSPARGAGDPTHASPYTFNGTPWSGTPDIGAY